MSFLQVKLTKEEKRKARKIEKNLHAKILTKVTEFGFPVCPHCQQPILSVPEEPGTFACSICEKQFLIDEELIKMVRENTERLQKILDKVKPFVKDTLKIIEETIDKNCDINEVALLCRYYQCNIQNLAQRFKESRAL